MKKVFYAPHGEVVKAKKVAEQLIVNSPNKIKISENLNYVPYSDVLKAQAFEEQLIRESNNKIDVTQRCDQTVDMFDDATE